MNNFPRFEFCLKFLLDNLFENILFNTQTRRPAPRGGTDSTITIKVCGYFQIVDGIIVDLINTKSLQANHSKPQASSNVGLQDSVVKVVGGFVC